MLFMTTEHSFFQHSAENDDAEKTNKYDVQRHFKIAIWISSKKKNTGHIFGARNVVQWQELEYEVKFMISEIDLGCSTVSK